MPPNIFDTLDDTLKDLPAPTFPNTTTATSHGITIRVKTGSYTNANDTVIGMIQTWAPAQSRAAGAIYELNASGSGEVYEQVPGNLGGLTISVTRYDLFKSRMETVWGFNMKMLTDQNNPIEIRERFRHPDGTHEIDAYMGCWFTSLGRNLGAQGDRLINVNATLVYTDKIGVI
jgi:hypothetical protein